MEQKEKKEEKDKVLSLKKWVDFVVSRALGTVVDTVVLWAVGLALKAMVSAHPASGFWNDFEYWGEYLIGPTISFEVATFANFLMSYYWIWKNRISNRSSAKSFWRHFGGFNVSCIFGFFVKMIFLVLFGKLFGWDAWVCNLLAVCISGILNYFLAEVLVFRKKTERPEHELLSIEELGEMAPVFKGAWGQWFGKCLFSLVGVNKMNRLYNSIYDIDNARDASRRLLENMGCNYLIGNAERLEHLPEGAFITISNHPYGGLDGIILLDLFLPRRPDYKVMVNDILGRIAPLRPAFITVNPTTTKKGEPTRTTLNGVRETIMNLNDGHPVGFFPSGAVSDLHIGRKEIADREWQESMIHLIKKARVPIVPVHFIDHNSWFYYSLGLIDWKVRLLRLPRELFNKSKGRHRVVIGETISVERQAILTDMDAYRAFLRASVYQMPVPENFTPSRPSETSSK